MYLCQIGFNLFSGIELLTIYLATSISLNSLKYLLCPFFAILFLSFSFFYKSLIFLISHFDHGKKQFHHLKKND